MVRILKNLKKKDWGLIACAVGFIVVQVWLDLRLPDYMSEITRLVKTEGNLMREVLIAGGKMLLCALGSLLSSVGVAVLAARVAVVLANPLLPLYHSFLINNTLDHLIQDYGNIRF